MMTQEVGTQGGKRGSPENHIINEPKTKQNQYPNRTESKAAHEQDLRQQPTGVWSTTRMIATRFFTCSACYALR